MSVEDLAAKLSRSEAFVRKHIATVPTHERIEEQSDWVSRLHASVFWTEVRKGLIGSEVGFFERAWAAYSDQFSSASDLLATDELMIRDLIMLDIFSMRAVLEQSSATRMIDDLEKAIEKEKELDEEIRNMLEAGQWQTQINSLKAARTALTKVHIDYQKQKNDKLRDLKGARDQRFKQIEESKRNFFDLVKDLDTHKRRVKEGQLAAKVQLAAKNVTQDWNQLHEFEDGEIDKPFVSPEGELEDDRLQNESE
jgi:hypothetical protein